MKDDGPTFTLAAVRDRMLEGAAMIRQCSADLRGIQQTFTAGAAGGFVAGDVLQAMDEANGPTVVQAIGQYQQAARDYLEALERIRRRIIWEHCKLKGLGK